MQILQTDFHTSLWGICGEILIKDQSIFPLVIILLILITFTLGYVLMLLQEKIDVGHCWDITG